MTTDSLDRLIVRLIYGLTSEMFSKSYREYYSCVVMSFCE